MILTENLTKKFDDFLAVDGVNLDVKAGQVLALLGPNGAGKTTTVRMLTSILVPASGRAWVGGYDVLEEPDKVRASVGVLTEHHGLYRRMNAREYLEFYGDLYGLKRSEGLVRSNSLLEQFGLSDTTQKRLGEYSKGMRQKLALVRALLHDPPVLLLDEPTSAMDPESARMVRDAIRGMRSGRRTIVLCTHNLSEAEELADQIAIIRRGKIILSGNTTEIKARLLGPAEFEARLASSVDGLPNGLPKGVEIVGHTANSMRFRIANSNENNPQVLARLIQAGYPVVEFKEIERSLEEAYLVAVTQEGILRTHV